MLRPNAHMRDSSSGNHSVEMVSSPMRAEEQYKASGLTRLLLGMPPLPIRIMIFILDRSMRTFINMARDTYS